MHHQSRVLVESNPLFLFLLSSTTLGFQTPGGVIHPPPLHRRKWQNTENERGLRLPGIPSLRSFDRSLSHLSPYQIGCYIMVAKYAPPPLALPQPTEGGWRPSAARVKILWLLVPHDRRFLGEKDELWQLKAERWQDDGGSHCENGFRSNDNKYFAMLRKAYQLFHR